MKLSERQEEILTYLARFQEENGYSPSLREIAEAFGLTSVATVHQHVAALEKKGYVKKDWNKGRSLELSEQAAQWMARQARKNEAAAAAAAAGVDADATAAGQADNVVSLDSWRPRAPESGAGAVEVPLLGQIAAGVPIEAIENRETVSVPADMVGRRETYVLKVRGNSMVGDGILDGDFVIVEKRDRASNGETVVALINNQEVTLKRFYIESDGVRLQPANPEIQPIHLKNGDFSIQGVMIGLLRKLRH